MFERLFTHAGPARLPGPPGPRTPAPLLPLLTQRDGFAAFDGALEVLSSADLHPWNARNAWRYAYGSKLDGLFFFAWDVLGGQFGFGERGVVHFEPDAGELVDVSDSIEGWARAVCANPAALAGVGVLRRWIASHGELPAGWRLAPKLPLALGGTLKPGNLIAGPAGQLMRERAGRSGAELPDGWEVRMVRRG